MNSDEQNKQVESGHEGGVRKQPYVRPRILSREPLEAMAVVCLPPTGKADAFNCPPSAGTSNLQS